MDEAVRSLLDAVRVWAAGTLWVDWLELGGSLGRGAGDAWSDLDAGIGVDEDVPLTAALADARAAAASFGAVAGSLVQTVGRGFHLITAYEDGRQLSLVLLPAGARDGLPLQAVAPLDRSGRLAVPLPAEHRAPDAPTLHEWAFLAWIAVGDAARHAHRGRSWRALGALTEGRDLAWRLWADWLDLPRPRFGAVRVEDADADHPNGMAGTLPATLETSELQRAASALGDVLDAVTPSELLPLAASIRRRMTALEAARRP